MSKKNITCKEANEICNKAQYGEASFLEKTRLSIHLITCRTCALYTKQNRALTKKFKLKAKECKLQKHELDEEQKNKLKEEFTKLLE